MDSAMNVTILGRGEMHQSRFTRCMKYTSISNNVTSFAEAKICKLLKFLKCEPAFPCVCFCFLFFFA